MPALAVIVVSHNSARWLPACLTSVVSSVGATTLELVVVDSGSQDATREAVEAHPPARHLACANHGFAYANNRGVDATVAPWVLFLNPDTEVVEGDLATLIATADRYPDVGIFGVRQVDGRGSLEPSMRRFPHPVRWFFEALGSERWTRDGRWWGQRVRRWESYDAPHQCDWTSGSAMLVRREVLVRTGGMDETYFLYCEEPDLSLRALRIGWKTMHLPVVTVVHYGGNEATSPALTAQLASSRSRYMNKHFTPPARLLGKMALALGFVLRLARPEKRSGSWAALLTVIGVRSSPFQAITIVDPPPNT